MAKSPYLTQEQFELLHRQVDETRKGSKVIKVDRQALVNLLMDFGKMPVKKPTDTEGTDND